MSGTARATEPPPDDVPKNCGLCAPRSVGHPSVMLGLAQWLFLRGGNVAFEYKTRHLAFEVSHGQGLDLNQLGGLGLSSAERDAGIRLRSPWTTGFGLGYRVTENLHLLVELKAHHYEVMTSDWSDRATYTTFSVGPGARAKRAGSLPGNLDDTVGVAHRTRFATCSGGCESGSCVEGVCRSRGR